jgi:hypothetical protein
MAFGWFGITIAAIDEKAGPMEEKDEETASRSS